MSAPNNDTEEYGLALRVAKLYYYQGLTTEEIAVELQLSRPKISRLLSLPNATASCKSV